MTNMQRRQGMNAKNRTRLALVAGLALLAATPVGAQTAAAPTSAAQTEDGAWRFAFTPYLWATSQKGEASFKGIPPQPIELSFGDIWENLDFAALGAFEAHNGRWGVATDMVFMNLGTTIPIEVLGLPDLGVDSRQFVFEATALYRVHRGAPREGMRSFVDLLAGARYNKVRAGLETSLIPDTERSFDWVDGVSAPASRRLSPRRWRSAAARISPGSAPTSPGRSTPTSASSSRGTGGWPAATATSTSTTTRARTGIASSGAW